MGCIKHCHVTRIECRMRAGPSSCFRLCSVVLNNYRAKLMVKNSRFSQEMEASIKWSKIGFTYSCFDVRYSILCWWMYHTVWKSRGLDYRNFFFLLADLWATVYATCTHIRFPMCLWLDCSLWNAQKFVKVVFGMCNDYVLHIGWSCTRAWETTHK